MKKSLFILLTLSLLCACPSEETTENTQASASPSTAATSETQTTKTTTKTLEKGVTGGIAVVSEGYATFKPCGSKEYMWLYDPNNDVQAKYSALKLSEMEPAYVELKGTVAPITVTEGAEMDYKNGLTVTEVKTVDAWNSSDCFQEEIIGQGADWNLHVIKGDEVLFKDGKSDFPLVERLAYSPGKDGVYVFSYDTPNPDKLEVKLTAEACQAGGQTFSHKAEINFHEQVYTGCANLKS